MEYYQLKNKKKTYSIFLVRNNASKKRWNNLFKYFLNTNFILSEIISR